MFFLPCKECGGKCCTYPVFNEAEYRAIKSKLPKRGVMVMPMEHEKSYDPDIKSGDKGYVITKRDGTGVCPFLGKKGQCKIYDQRPKVCRDYGIVPDLPCEYLYPEKAKAKQLQRIQQSNITYKL